jgi:hypothetical protein
MEHIRQSKSAKSAKENVKPFNQVAGGRHLKLGLLLHERFCRSQVRYEKIPSEKRNPSEYDFINNLKIKI